MEFTPEEHGYISVGNKIYHAETYIKDAEMKKAEIKEAVGQLELYFEQNKRVIEWGELGNRGMRLNDALYYLNKIKEAVENA